MSVKEELTWDDYLTLILRHYADLPDEHTLTLGDMSGGEPALPAYRGFMQMTLGDLRKFRQTTQEN